MNELQKSRLIAAVVILLVFAAGVAVGASLHRTLPRHGFLGLAVGGPPSGPPPELQRKMLARLDRDLDLTSQQHARIDSVLTRRESDIRALMTETRPRFEAIASRTRSEIQAVLTPEQQAEFAKITKRIDERRRGAGHQ
jgi:Spy/CpxP family protein refolding chaperone